MKKDIKFLQQIEKTIISNYNVNYSVNNIGKQEYIIETIHGLYKFWFDYEGLISIFGRFTETGLSDTHISKTINPYSSKLNYHGRNEIAWFESDIAHLISGVNHA